MYVLCVWGYLQRPEEGIICPQSRSYRWLLATQHRYWELRSSQSGAIILTTELSPQHQFYNS